MINPNNVQLRQAAEARVAAVMVEGDVHADLAIRQLIRELQLHRIELEMQNEALRQSHHDLEASRDRFVDFYESAPVGYVALNERGVISSINQTGAKLLGYASSELIGSNFANFVAGENADDWHLHFIKAQRQEQKVSCELALDCAGGERVYVRIDSLRLLEGVEGLGVRHAMLRMVLTDITDLRLAISALSVAKEEADRANHAKTIFLANMSHEIRTPLNVIIGLGQLLRRDVIDARQQEQLDQLCGHSDYLLALLNDILEMSKIDADALTLEEHSFCLGAMVDRVMEMLDKQAEGKGVTLDVELDDELRTIWLRGDALRLAQILINLGNNAVKFTGRGGTVNLRILSCEDRLDPAIGLNGESASTVKKWQILRFIVDDTGIGITAANQAHLFQLFRQVDDSADRAYGGTGLGLAISQRLVMQMGGRISVKSQIAVGSQFEFVLRFPIEPAEPVATSMSDAWFNGKRILLAEDHSLSQKILRDMLEYVGCRVDAVSDGIEVLLMAQAEHYDLILMDVQMPKMDGLVATRELRLLPDYHGIPIIALTANAFAEDRQRCIVAGMNDHIGKPVTMDALVAVLHKWMAEDLVPVDNSMPSSVTKAVAGTATLLNAALAQAQCLDRHCVFRRSPEATMDYYELVCNFIAMHRGDMVLLQQLLADGQTVGASGLVHKLIGIASMIGANRIVAEAHLLMQELRRGADKEVLEEHIARCAGEFNALIAEMESLPAQCGMR